MSIDYVIANIIKDKKKVEQVFHRHIINLILTTFFLSFHNAIHHSEATHNVICGERVNMWAETKLNNFTWKIPKNEHEKSNIENMPKSLFVTISDKKEEDSCLQRREGEVLKLKEEKGCVCVKRDWLSHIEFEKCWRKREREKVSEWRA